MRSALRSTGDSATGKTPFFGYVLNLFEPVETIKRNPENQCFGFQFLPGRFPWCDNRRCKNLHEGTNYSLAKMG
jgi:hypothetical protein